MSLSLGLVSESIGPVGEIVAGRVPAPESGSAAKSRAGIGEVAGWSAAAAAAGPPERRASRTADGRRAAATPYTLNPKPSPLAAGTR